MFLSNFRFYKGYSIPLQKTCQDYLNYIDELPFIDSAQIFGLHPNADITLVLHAVTLEMSKTSHFT